MVLRLASPSQPTGADTLIHRSQCAATVSIYVPVFLVFKDTIWQFQNLTELSHTVS